MQSSSEEFNNKSQVIHNDLIVISALISSYPLVLPRNIHMLIHRCQEDIKYINNFCNDGDSLEIVRVYARELAALSIQLRNLII